MEKEKIDSSWDTPHVGVEFVDLSEYIDTHPEFFILFV